MPKPTKGPRLGGSPTHERFILRNLATQLIEHGQLTTTETKARRVQPVVEKMITKAKRGDLHARRLVLKSVTDKSVVAKLFSEIAPALADRDGGYTRITKLGPRQGDNAPMAIISIVTETVEESRAARTKAGKAAGVKSKVEVTSEADTADQVEAKELDEAVAASQDAEVEAASVDADEVDSKETEQQQADQSDDAESKTDQASAEAKDDTANVGPEADDAAAKAEADQGTAEPEDAAAEPEADDADTANDVSAKSDQTKAAEKR